MLPLISATNKFLVKRIYLVFVVLFFLACGPDQPQEKTVAKSEEKVEQNPVPLYSNEEPAGSPAVIRPPASRRTYGYKADTSQVSQYIRQIFQDTKGDLWFGTVGEGVCRYDGATLTYFTTKDGFAGGSVQDIIQDRYGNMWFATETGISKFNGTSFKNYSVKDGLVSDHVFSLLEDRTGVLWIGTGSGVCRSTDPLAGDSTRILVFKPFLFPGAEQNPEVRSIIQDRSGNIWLATSGAGVYRFSGSAIRRFSKSDGLSHEVVHCVLQDRSAGLWFATDGGGISRYDQASEFVPGAPLFSRHLDEKGDNRVTTLYEDRAGNIWSSVRGSVRCYDIRQRGVAAQMASYRSFSAADGLANCCIQSFLEDRTGNLWLGSGAGLFRVFRNRESHPCVRKTCDHDLKTQTGLESHQAELVKTIVNVTKQGPWPKRFRS